MKKTLPSVTHGLGLIIVILVLFISSSISVQAAAKSSAQQQLEAAVAGAWRSPQNIARDKYRHPLQTLTFFGVTPTATLIELLPSGTAWYTEILAPFLHDHGEYIAVNIPGNPEDAGQKEKFAADPAHYGKIKILEITPVSIDFGAPGSADFFLTFRNVHNFAMKGDQGKLFNAIFKVLKSGGVLGVVDHRAEAGKSLEQVLDSGYLPEDFVIAEAEKAGFKLIASSVINNNIKDSKNYPQGVWTLPPTLAEGEKDRKKYLAIGESDRFTLRFIKP